MPDTMRKWRLAANEARRELTKAIKRAKHARLKGNKAQFRCVEWTSGLCSGIMIIRRHDAKCPLWNGEECDCTMKLRTRVWAHCLPVFAQCSGCGFAPLLAEQTVLLGRLAAGK